MLIFFCLFLALLIIGKLLKNSKILITGIIGFCISTATLILNIAGLRFSPTLDYPLGIAMGIVVFVCTIAIIPKLYLKIFIGIILALLFILCSIIFEKATANIEIEDQSYAAEFNKMNVGPVLISYYEEVFPFVYKNTPSFYAGYTNLVSWEKIVNAIEENDVGDFFTNPEDLYN